MTDLMADAQTLPRRLRDTLTPLLPTGAFLRRDRGDALFVTNAACIDKTSAWPQIFEAIGYSCETRGSLLALSPSYDFFSEWEQHAPPDFFCETLLRFRNLPPCAEATQLFIDGVKLLEQPVHIEKYIQRVRELAAVCLRTSQGGVYGCALIAYVLERKEISQ